MTDTQIGKPDRLRVADLQTFTRNPRRGDVDAIADSLKANGQYRPIVVNAGTHTGRDLEVLAGNHTLMAAQALGWSEVDVWLVDVDDDAARRIVAADNRLPDLGGYDDAALFDLLDGLDDLTGTGYSAAELDALAQLIDAPTLDELADQYGDPKPEDSWVRIAFKVPPETEKAWRAAVEERGDDEAVTLAALLGLVL